jgi:ribonuclease R
MSSKDKNPVQGATYTGTVDHVAASHAYIIVSNLAEDIFVLHKNLAGTMHQDVVQVQVVGKRRDGSLEGRVVEIVTPQRKSLVGNVIELKESYAVVVDHKRYPHPILLADDEGKKQLGNKVVVSVTSRGVGKSLAQGKIKEVLGPIGSYEAETSGLMAQYDLSDRFSATVEQEVADLPGTLSAEDREKRRDFVGIPTFTIDPDDAKDFDDALSIRPHSKGGHEIAIHIADVTHYIKEGTALDKEALRRGTSVYLVGKCVSMLPERLANDLCSLKPKVDRAAFSVVFHVDTDGKFTFEWLGESLIHSQRRFTYGEAQEILDVGKGEFVAELNILNKLAKAMRAKRMRKGGIAFTSTDIAITLNDEGVVTSIKPKPTLSVHELIEEYMLLANRSVSTWAMKAKQGEDYPPFLHRIHDAPDSQKVASFAFFVKHLGLHFSPKAKGDSLGKSFNNLLQEAKDKPYNHAVQTLAMRTMSQARYGTFPAGHFGLGFDYYTHFTSPIRRYPDLVVHRLTKRYLAEGSWPARTWYDEVAQHTSSREREAVVAERASNNHHQVYYMKQFEGQTFQAIVSGVKEWGIYAEMVSNGCEGMIRLASLKDDYYVYDEKKHCVRGARRKKVYALGDTIKVKIKSCNLEKRVIDLLMAPKA